MVGLLMNGGGGTPKRSSDTYTPSEDHPAPLTNRQGQVALDLRQHLAAINASECAAHIHLAVAWPYQMPPRGSARSNSYFGRFFILQHVILMLSWLLLTIITIAIIHALKKHVRNQTQDGDIHRNPGPSDRPMQEVRRKGIKRLAMTRARGSFAGWWLGRDAGCNCVTAAGHRLFFYFGSTSSRFSGAARVMGPSSTTTNQLRDALSVLAGLYGWPLNEREWGAPTHPARTTQPL